MKRITPIRKQTALTPNTGAAVVLRFLGYTALVGSTLFTSTAIAQTYQQHPTHPQSQQQMPHPQMPPSMPVQPHGQMPPPRISAQPPMQQPPMQKGRQRLGQWLSSHQNETPEQQQRSLAREPGFNTLSPDQQARMQQRLTQLNAMPPAQRQRTLAHMEAMDRLTADQRQQVRGALAGLGSLPPDQRHAVAHSFNQLRALPPDQRQKMMNSPQFRDQFTDQQRGTLTNLMSVEQLLPPRTATAATSGH